jgi:cobaltochelatase CobS
MSISPETPSSLVLRQEIGDAPRPESGQYIEWAAERRYRIQQWLILRGVPEKKAFAASNLVLYNAYRIGDNYIRRMIEGDGPKSTPRNTVRIDLDDGVKKILNELESEQEQPLVIPEPAPKPDSKPIPGTIDPLAIARAADAVITPRIEGAIKRLRLEFEDAVREIQPNEEFKDQVLELATRVATNTSTVLATEIANKIIRENLPTRLEIYNEGKVVRELPRDARHSKFPSILKWLSVGKHVYIVGPKGTGKTHLFHQLAGALGRDDIVPIGQSLTKYDLSGYKSPTGEYIGTLMRDAIEFGHFVVIDEGDMWAAAALGFLNSALAGNGFCSFPDKVVTVHPNFLVVIAANTYGHGADRQYQGRNPLDAASLDRFVFIEVDYDPIMEKQIYGDTAWLRYVHKVRLACAQLAIPHLIPSMRAIDKGLEGYRIGLEPNEIADAVLWMGAAADTIAKIKNIAGEPPRRAPVEIESEESKESVA